jgi:branched-chain amino acid aminotransferase
MYYVNGHYVEPANASLPILDLGLLRGFAIFDYLRTYGGRCFHLEEHLLRLQYSARELGISLPLSLEEISEIILETKRRNTFLEAGIKIVVTGGISDDQFTPTAKSHIAVLVYPHTPPSPQCFQEGISVVTTRLFRSLPTSKTTQYIPGIVALRNTGAKEALYLNAQGKILEATTSNFFAFHNGILRTCDSEEILFGITREILLSLAKPLFPIDLHPVSYDEIAELEEAFITASNKEIMPVVQIDGRPIGSGKVGAHTRRLMDLFRAYTEQKSWPPVIIPRYTTFR